MCTDDVWSDVDKHLVLEQCAAGTATAFASSSCRCCRAALLVVAAAVLLLLLLLLMQVTFSEAGLKLPPWEMLLPWT